MFGVSAAEASSAPVQHALNSFVDLVENALTRTGRHPMLAFAALLLIKRARTRPLFAAQCWRPTRLWLAAFMLANKVVEDASFFNTKWAIAAEGRYTVPEINAMERALCACLEWDLRLEEHELFAFVQQMCSTIAPRGRGMDIADMWPGKAR
jgi:hypothetical protein